MKSLRKTFFKYSKLSMSTQKSLTRLLDKNHIVLIYKKFCIHCDCIWRNSISFLLWYFSYYHYVIIHDSPSVLLSCNVIMNFYITMQYWLFLSSLCLSIYLYFYIYYLSLSKSTTRNTINVAWWNYSRKKNF